MGTPRDKHPTGTRLSGQIIGAAFTADVEFLDLERLRLQAGSEPGTNDERRNDSNELPYFAPFVGIAMYLEQ